MKEKKTLLIVKEDDDNVAVVIVTSQVATLTAMGFDEDFYVPHSSS
jgi:hypothetical protein